MTALLVGLTLGPGAEVSAWRGLLAVVIVFGLLAALAWLASRGRLRLPGRRAGLISVEGTCALGERRLLLVVGVDGRRFLLGTTPTQVSLITELAQSAHSFSRALDQASAAGAQETA